jgi:hypothetical protein
VGNYIYFIRLGSNPLIHKSIGSFGLLAMVIGLLLPSFSHAAFGFKLDGTLDKDAISHAYFEGEFSRVLPPLEMYRQSFPASSTKDDSIFVYKYLSVIYAADPSTRNKGESCMVQLIKMKPTIELIDLYISDNIAAIFKDVKQNYLHQQQYVREHDLLGNEKTDTTVAKAPPKARSHKWIWWTASAVSVAAIATTAVVLLDDESSPQKSFEPIKP